MRRRPTFAALLATGVLAALPARPGRAEVYLQYFETPWSEIADRLPEVVQAGYALLWLPPPSKGCEGTADPGYAVFDRFDLGDKHQRGTTATRYGTRAQLRRLTREVHRLGAKVIFDVIMNHNGNPSLVENAHVTLKPVAIDAFPGTLPEDYHLLPGRTSDGSTYEVKQPAARGGGTAWLSPLSGGNPEAYVAAVKMPAGVSVPGYTHLVRAPRIQNWDYAWEVQNYSLLGLVDFALDQHLNAAKTGVDKATDGYNNLTGLALPAYVRQPGCAACYPSGKPVAEDIRQYLHRWIWWLSQETDADGYRLDAIKHVPPAFFNYDFAGDAVAFNKAIQDDYDARRGYKDGDDDDGVKDAVLFGESYTGIEKVSELQDYRETGMRLLNFPLMFKLLDLFSAGTYGGGDLGQLSYPHPADQQKGAWVEFGGLGRADGVHFAQSHDQQPPSLQEDLAFAFVLTRPGDAVVFFDGNNYDAKSWVAPGRSDALGDGGDTITTLVSIHNHYARGGMHNRFVDDDAYVYERVVAGKGAALLVALHDNVGSDSRVGPDGVARFGEYDPRPLVVTAFPPGTVLTDLTGNSPTKTITVLDPKKVSSAAVQAAEAKYKLAWPGNPLPTGYGLAYLSVPSGPAKNYAAYGVAPPRGPASGARAVSLLQAGQRVADVTLQTVGDRRTYAGVRVPAVKLTVPRVTGKEMEIRLRVSASADAAYALLDAGGEALGGVQPATGTPEGLWEGYVPMKRGDDLAGDRTFSLAGVDVSSLPEGNHVLRVRAVDLQADLPPVLETFPVPFVVDRSLAPPEPPEPEDTDGDGVDDDKDNCPRAANADQADFDGDRVGDLCDLCPLTAPGTPRGALDDDGCAKVDPALLTRADAIIEAIRGAQPATDSLDVNGDGAVDVRDLVQEIDRVHAR